jgi:uncharacterized protein (TIGR02118 family)
MAMVKAIYFIKRKPGMDLDAFGAYWRTTHAELVKKVPGLRGYVQSQTIGSAYRKGEPVYDGVAMLWYDDTDTMRRIADTPESRAAVADDARFIDMTSFSFVVTEEVVQKEGRINPSMVKLVEFINRKPGMAPEAFQKYWRESHGPLAAKIPVMRRYVQNHVRLSAYRSGREPLYDGVVEVWFDSTDAMRESEKTPEYAAVRADEPNLLDGSRLAFIITRENRIL